VRTAAIIALLPGLPLAFIWLWTFGMTSAFAGGVEFPPTLGDFAFAPRIYWVIYGMPVFLIVLFVAAWAVSRLIKSKRTHASN
jgi:hypothetical protein